MCALFCFWSLPAYAEEGAHPTFSYVLVRGVALAKVVALAMVRAALMSSTWSLADALSEEADVSVDGEGKPILDKDGKPQVVAQLKASSSRFIALIGLIGILMIFLGFGLTILQGFASSGAFPDDTKIKGICLYSLRRRDDVRALHHQ